MALSILNPCMSFSSTHSMLKPASLTFIKPSSTACRNVGDTTSIRCTRNDISGEKSNVRRSGNYAPPAWDDDFFQSLTSDFKGEICSKYASDLKEHVRMLLNKEEMDSLHKLELVDSVQRLGVGYHFEDEIKRILEAIYNNEK